MATIGCSSTGVRNVSCDFVTGAYESKHKRTKNNTVVDRNKGSHAGDLFNGLMEVLFGPLERSIKSDGRTIDNKEEPCL